MLAYMWYKLFLNFGYDWQWIIPLLSMTMCMFAYNFHCPKIMSYNINYVSVVEPNVDQVVFFYIFFNDNELNEVV